MYSNSLFLSNIKILTPANVDNIYAVRRPADVVEELTFMTLLEIEAMLKKLKEEAFKATIYLGLKILTQLKWLLNPVQQCMKVPKFYR